MAAGAVTGVYNSFKERVMEGTFVLDNAGTNVRIALVVGYTPNYTTHNSYADVVASEFVGTGYTAKGKLLTTKTVTATGTVGMFDADDVTWTSLAAGSGTPSHAILYLDSGTNSTSYLILAWELGVPANGGDYKLTFGSTGLLRIT